MKTISIFLALINTVTAGVLLAITVSATVIRQNEIMWFLMKILSACFVIATGVLTWLSNTNGGEPGALPLANLILIALGAGTVTWTVHLFLTGVAESYMAYFGSSLIFQGMTSLLGMESHSRDTMTP